MSIHSYSKIWVHIIWETHNREKLLNEKAAKAVSEYLFNYSKEHNIFMKVNYVNPEHVHTLIDLPTKYSIEECLKLLKGSSSHFVNENQLTIGRFSWGRGYAALTISPSVVDKVVEYIKNQREHHRFKGFSEEYADFIQKYSIELNR
ncbi:MAG TPA: IS200/IS605 family transposase [Ignavibacteriaceae bacterium]